MYAERDLERLEQIIALKFLGVPLKQIKNVLDRPEPALLDTLRLQRRALEEKQQRVSRAICAIRAAEAAISNPLLEDTSMAAARGLLLTITGGDDLTLFEVDQAANRVRGEVDEEANIIFGSVIDETLSGRIRVSVVATGIDAPAKVEHELPRLTVFGGGAMPIPLPAHASLSVAMPASATPGHAPSAFRSELLAPAIPAAPEASRPSLFSQVSGVLRRRLPAPQPEAATARSDSARHEPRPERDSVRQTAAEEVGFDIPAFLRRQSS